MIAQAEGSINTVQNSIIFKKPNRGTNRYKYNQLLYNHFVNKDFALAQQLIDRIFEEFGESHEFANLIQGYILKMTAKLSQSIESFKKCLIFNEKDPEVLKTIAKNLYSSYLNRQLVGRNKASLDVAQEALKTKPNDWELHFTLGNCFFANKDQNRAIASYKRAFELSVNETTYTKLGKLYTAQEQYEEAITIYRQAIQKMPQNQELKTFLAGVLLRLGQNEEALHYLQQAQQNDPRTLLSVGSILQDQSKYDESLKQYRKLIQFHPTSAQIWNNIAMCYYGKDQLLAAIACLKKALYFDPFEQTIQFNMGLVQLVSKQYVSAFHYFQAAISLNPDEPQAYMYLGIALDKLGDFDNAQRAFVKALSIEKDYLIYLNYCILLLQRGDQHMSKALEMFNNFSMQFQLMSMDTRCTKEEIQQTTLQIKSLF